MPEHQQLQPEDEWSPAQGARQRRQLVGLMLLLVGFGVAGWGLIVVLRARRVQSWPTSVGAIQATTLSQDVVGYEAGKAISHMIFDLRCHVRYQYRVGDRLLTSEQIDVRPPGVHNARADCARYAVGQRVVVFYDPASPEQAVLDRRVPVVGIIAAAIGLVAMFMGIGRQGWFQSRAPRVIPVAAATLPDDP
jgi:hypothetical protein